MKESSRSLQLHHLFPVLSEKDNVKFEESGLGETERELLRMCNGKVSLAELPLLMSLSVSDTMKYIRNLIASERIELQRLYSPSSQDDWELERETDSKEGLQYHFPVDGDISPAEATEWLLESLSSSELLLAEDIHPSPISVSAVSGHPKEVPLLGQRHPSSPSNPVDATLVGASLDLRDSLKSNGAEESVFVVEPTAPLPIVNRGGQHEATLLQNAHGEGSSSSEAGQPRLFHTLEPLNAVPSMETFLQMESEIATQEELPASSGALVEQTEWEQPSISSMSSDELEDTSPEEEEPSFHPPASLLPPMFEPTATEVPVVGYKPAAKIVVEAKPSALRGASSSEKVGPSLRSIPGVGLSSSISASVPMTKQKRRKRGEPTLLPGKLGKQGVPVVVVRGKRKP
ncbi:MAG: hypothetical protein EP343_06510 [Deltaproteobacteria bacterium]|nr:MAG: hypothetical protein EP343_06510 [Deltaproteobacteria bacterium]